MVKSSSLPIMSATVQTERQQGAVQPSWSAGGIVHRAMPIPVLTHMKATAIQVTMASKPVKILAPYLSPFRPLSGAGLSACFDGGMSVLMAGDRNAKHVDWNSRLSTRRGNFLRDYADGNSCLFFGPHAQPLTHTTPWLLPVCWTL
jgi:hypothetical protein